MRIRAAVLESMGAAAPYVASEPLRVRTVELDPPGHGEVLVRIAATGLCHSDLSVIEGNRPRPMPMALGHEAAGVVEEVGPGVADLAHGDHVVCTLMPSCGHCLPCAEGRPTLCEPGGAANVAGHLLGGARRLHLDGALLHHHLGVSGFAEYATVSRRSLVRVDPEVPLEAAALFSCAVLTGVGAVINTARVPAGASVAVVGLGGVGLCALLGAVAAGAGEIVAVDLAPDRLAFAEALGATAAFDARDPDVAAQVRDATRGGVEYAFELAGAVKALELAWTITRRGGSTVTAGLPPPTAALPVPAVALVAEERTLKGSYIGSSVPMRDIPRYLALFQRGRLPIDRLLTHRLTLDELNVGFDRLREGQAIRQIVLPGGAA